MMPTNADKPTLEDVVDAIFGNPRLGIPGMQSDVKEIKEKVDQLDIDGIKDALKQFHDFKVLLRGVGMLFAVFGITNIFSVYALITLLSGGGKP